MLARRTNFLLNHKHFSECVIFCFRAAMTVTPKASKGFQRISKDSIRLQRTPEDSRGLQRTPEDSKELQRTLRSFRGLQRKRNVILFEVLDFKP